MPDHDIENITDRRWGAAEELSRPSAGNAIILTPLDGKVSSVTMPNVYLDLTVENNRAVMMEILDAVQRAVAQGRPVTNADGNR